MVVRIPEGKPNQGFRPTPLAWQGYIPTQEGSEVFITRPSAKLAYLYGLVVQIAPDGAEKPAYPNIVRLEPSGGLTVPFHVDDDGLARIGLRPQFRVFVTSDFGRYDEASAAHGKRIAALEAEFCPPSPADKPAPALGARLLALHDTNPIAWAGVEAHYVTALKTFVEDLRQIGFGRWSVEVPGGYGAYGEKTTEAARRQFYEEITAKHAGVVPGSWQPLGTIVANRGHEAYPIHLLAARIDPAHVADTENVAASAAAKPDPFDPKNPLTFCGLQDLETMAAGGTLLCGLTEAAIGRYVRKSLVDPKNFPPLR